MKENTMSEEQEIEQVGEIDPNKHTSPIVDTRVEDVDGDENIMATSCLYNGKKYSEGSTVCMSGKKHECLSNGKWWNSTRSC